MAGRSVKKKNSTAPLKKAVTLIAVFVVLLFTVLIEAPPIFKNYEIIIRMVGKSFFRQPAYKGRR